MAGAAGAQAQVGQGRLELSLLRGFAVQRDGRPVEMPRSGQRLVAFLALQARPLARVFVAGTLWMDVDEDRAAAALRTALWRLGTAGAPELVRSLGSTLSLSPAVTTDVDRASHRARELVDRHDARPGDVELLREAGDLLPDWYDDWIVIERERFRQLRVQALEALCEELTLAGDHAHATDAGLSAVACEPLRESAHRARISAHLAQGNAVEALRQYRLYRGLLQRSLGLKPSAAIRELIASSVMAR